MEDSDQTRRREEETRTEKVLVAAAPRRRPLDRPGAARRGRLAVAAGEARAGPCPTGRRQRNTGRLTGARARDSDVVSRSAGELAGAVAGPLAP